MRQGMVRCYGCANPLPAALINDHHKRPRATGGSDARSNRSLICPLCHTTVHQACRYFVKGRVNQAKDLVNLWAKGDSVMVDRLMDLVQIEARAWIDGGKSDLQRVTFDLERGVYEGLKAIAQATVNQDGKPIGIGRLLRQITRRWLKTYMSQHGMISTDPLDTKNQEVLARRERPQIDLKS
jgi:hypothetical protein